ncbi:MAG: hypothetical protein KGS09_10340, partial [Nitrospirae bacterium]|nr:hypothetical protein [Nitrospirota bacterium]MDE3052085.1 hypothetical protein [Nitrospirota bacterium]
VQLKDLLRQINPNACDVHHVDSLLLVMVGSHRSPGETHGTEVGESIPLEKIRRLRSQEP